MRPRLEHISPVPFFGSTVIAICLIVFASTAPERAAAMVDVANAWIIAEAGWFYLLAVGVFVIFLLSLALSPLGRIRLGPDDSVPDYRFGTWVAMLFSGGMGIGIVFYGVAEPITHFAFPPDAEAGSPQAARDAMEVTFFHWGVHAWAIYAVVGLALAYFSFRQGLPLTIRSSLYPLIGERIHGPIGHAVDVFAVVGTLFGVATSLGFGAIQVNAGLEYLFDVPVGTGVQIALIAVITAFATVSVAGRASFLLRGIAPSGGLGQCIHWSSRVPRGGRAHCNVNTIAASVTHLPSVPPVFSRTSPDGRGHPSGVH